MDEMDRTIQLANAIACLLDGEEFDDIIPSLAMVLHHVSKSSGMPMKSIASFVNKALLFESEAELEATKH